jgi:hypothetical protein
MLQRLAFRGRRAWQGVATFVRYVAATVDSADQAVQLRVDGAAWCELLPGDEVQLSEPAADFEVVPNDPDMAGVLAAGVSRLRPATVTGEIELDSGWRQVMRGRQGALSYAHQAAAGQFPVIVIRHDSIPGVGWPLLTVRSVLAAVAPGGPVRAVSLSGTVIGGVSANAMNRDLRLNAMLGGSIVALDAPSPNPATIGGAAASSDALFQTASTTAAVALVQAAPWVMAHATGQRSVAIIGQVEGALLTVNAAFELGNR